MDEADYSAYLIEARIILDAIGEHARRRMYWEAATKAAALAVLAARLASALTRKATAR